MTEYSAMPGAKPHRPVTDTGPPQLQLRVKRESAPAVLAGGMSVPPLALAAAACYTEIRDNALVSCGWGDR